MALVKGPLIALVCRMCGASAVTGAAPWILLMAVEACGKLDFEPEVDEDMIAAAAGSAGESNFAGCSSDGGGVGESS